MCSVRVYVVTSDKVATGSVFVPKDVARVLPVGREIYELCFFISAQRRVITRPEICMYPPTPPPRRGRGMGMSVMS